MVFFNPIHSSFYRTHFAFVFGTLLPTYMTLCLHDIANCTSKSLNSVFYFSLLKEMKVSITEGLFKCSVTHLEL